MNPVLLRINLKLYVHELDIKFKASSRRALHQNYVRVASTRTFLQILVGTFTRTVPRVTTGSMYLMEIH